MNKILLIVSALIGLVIGGASSVAVVRATREQPLPCPACNCPAAVSLQNFDLDKLNNKKGTFSYSPQLHGVTIKIESKDSVLLKQILKNCD